MQRQPIRVEKIVTNLHFAIEQNRHLVSPLCLERRVLVDIDDSIIDVHGHAKWRIRA